MLDESDLLSAVAVFAFLLPGDGVVDVLKAIELDEAVDVVSGYVRAGAMYAILGYA